MKYFLEEEYEYEFDLIGISCHEKNYRVCWALNRALDLALEKEEMELEVLVKKSNRFSKHSLYGFQDEETMNQFHLLGNRSGMGYLIPEMPHADYLLMIKENYPINFDNLLQEIRNIPFVLTAFTLDVMNLKSKENLIF